MVWSGLLGSISRLRASFTQRFGFVPASGCNERVGRMIRERYDLEDRLIGFAVQVCLLANRFPTTPIAKHVATQITRSATSPFANYAEAQGAESRQDFVHKLKVCLKELRETQAWLKFVERMSFCTENVEAVKQECDELVAILVASVRTASGKCKMSNIE